MFCLCWNDFLPTCTWRRYGPVVPVMGSSGKVNASWHSKRPKVECAKTSRRFAYLRRLRPQQKYFLCISGCQQKNAMNFMQSNWNAEIHRVWKITCFLSVAPTQCGNRQQHSKSSAIRFHTALMDTGITMKTAAEYVNYYVTRVANPCGSRQASVDGNTAATNLATVGTSSV